MAMVRRRRQTFLATLLIATAASVAGNSLKTWHSPNKLGEGHAPRESAWSVPKSRALTRMVFVEDEDRASPALMQQASLLGGRPNSTSSVGAVWAELIGSDVSRLEPDVKGQDMAQRTRPSAVKMKVRRGRPVARVCDHEGCGLVAKFGNPTHGGPVKCRMHKTPDHCLLRGWTPCLHAEGCTRKAAFGFASGRPIYCQSHKSAAHVSLSFRGRKCLFHGCSKQPSFGSLEDARIRFCRQHKMAGDVDLRLLRCRHPEGCLKGATFALPGCKVPRRCAAHRILQDVRVTALKNTTASSFVPAQVSVCPRCLDKISKRNMAKHANSAHCHARAASPYIKHKRRRMGRDVTDALNGRMGRRHPTLSETPALHPEDFILLTRPRVPPDPPPGQPLSAHPPNPDPLPIFFPYLSSGRTPIPYLSSGQPAVHRHCDASPLRSLTLHRHCDPLPIFGPARCTSPLLSSHCYQVASPLLSLVASPEPRRGFYPRPNL
jgi:hypothetical protein